MPSISMASLVLGVMRETLKAVRQTIIRNTKYIKDELVVLFYIH
jgi:hypothetical protein